MARARESTSRPAAKSDAYTGLLLISLLAQIMAATFFFLDWSSYPDKKPTVPGPPTISSPAGAGGAPAGGGQGGVPAGGGQAGGPAMGGGNPGMGGGPPMGGDAPK